MAFAIFYNREDATRIAAEFTRSDLPNEDRNYANALWGAGLNQWNVDNPDPRPEEQPTDANMIVINGNWKGQPLTLAQLRAFLYKWSTAPSAGYLAALADDMGGKSGAEEPWPRV